MLNLTRDGNLDTVESWREFRTRKKRKMTKDQRRGAREWRRADKRGRKVEEDIYLFAHASGTRCSNLRGKSLVEQY